MAGRTLQHEEDSQIQPATPDEESSANTSGWAKVQKKVRINDDRPERPTLIPIKSDEEVKSAYLREGDSHKVWRPKKAPQLANLVSDLVKKERAKQKNEPSVATTPSGQRPSLTPTGVSKGNLKARQKTVFNRLVATQELLRETTDELLKEEGDDQPKPQSHLSLLEASKKISANIKKQRSAEKEGKEDFSSVVRKCLEKVRSEDSSSDAHTPTSDPSPTSKSAMSALRNRRVSRRGSRIGLVPLKKWKNVAREETKGWVGKNPTYDRTISEYPLHRVDEVPEPIPEHRSLGRSTSAGVTSSDGSNFGVTFVDPKSSANGHHPSSPMNVTISDSSATTPPTHQPLVKKDSHGVMKKSPMAQLKGAAGRRGSAGLPRQEPIDVEASLASLAASGAVSGGERLLLSDPPPGKREEKLYHPTTSEEGVTSTML